MSTKKEDKAPKAAKASKASKAPKAPKASKAEPTDEEQRPDLPVTVLAQYIRDVSFENPNAPESLKAHPEQPKMDMNIGMDARKIPDDEHDNMYEVILSARVSAMRDDLPLFLMDVQYGITVLIDEKISEENIHPLLLIEMPRLTFPYVRMLVSTLTAHGGFPPLFLTPVDFQTLYMQRFTEEMESLEKEAVKERNEKNETVN